MKHIRMPKATWEKWDAALRSGEYAQGQDYLHNEFVNTFCCLGVLQHCIDGKVIPNGDEELPHMDWLKAHDIHFFNVGGRPTNDPYISTTKNCVSFLNDTEVSGGVDVPRHRYNFVDIAEFIKQEVEFTDA